MYGYAYGAKRNEQNRIRELNAQGKTPEEISRILLIRLECIQSFVNKFNKKPAKKNKAKPKNKAVTQSAPPVAPTPPSNVLS